MSTPQQQPAHVSPATAAGSQQLGGSNGSGSVEAWNALQRGYANAEALTPLMGHVVEPANAAQLIDLPPDSVYADRPLYGGVRTEAAFSGFQPYGPMTGGHVELTQRAPVVLTEGGAMEPQQWGAAAEWRDAPAVTNLCRRGSENLPGGLTGSGL